MAGASDKARFYLEQSVPELLDLRKKKLFTEQEINAIAKKRSDFEHKLNARGSQPSDYARYAEYEMNLESLRRKRLKRQGLKNMGHAGQRRIFLVLDRATRKFPGDLGLWMQYLDFANKQKANKKLSQVLTGLLRLHPTKPAIWIYAANHALDVKDDMTEARSYMQRGLRFCKHSKNLWLEYTKLEMLHISKIVARSRVLGLNGTRNIVDDANEDMMALPSITALAGGADAPPDESVDRTVLEQLQQTPALSGAIPVAILDAAMQQFNGDCTFGREFFDQVAAFNDVPCMPKILEHIVERLRIADPSSLETLDCFIRKPTLGIPVKSIEFPGALSSLFSRYRSCTDTTSIIHGTCSPPEVRKRLAHSTMYHVLHYLNVEASDDEVSRVIVAMLKAMWTDYAQSITNDNSASLDEIVGLLDTFQSKGLDELATSVSATGLRIWPKDERLLAARDRIMLIKKVQ